MKLAIMQPYCFPYIGYFQLINAVDTFVFYDDVAFIKQGWINRNRILVAGRPFFFTVPIQSASSFAPINQTILSQERIPRWRRRFLRTLAESYAGSPNLELVKDLVEEVTDSGDRDIASLAQRSVVVTSRLLHLHVAFLISSRDFPGSTAHGWERVLDICRAAGSACYVNAPGGRGLYEPGQFREAGLTLSFLEPAIDVYPQRGATSFVPRLSILDLLLSQDLSAARAAVRGGTLH